MPSVQRRTIDSLYARPRGQPEDGDCNQNRRSSSLGASTRGRWVPFWNEYIEKDFCASCGKSAERPQRGNRSRISRPIDKKIWRRNTHVAFEGGEMGELIRKTDWARTSQTIG